MISVYVGDTGPSVLDTLREYKSDGSLGPINLTGATVRFRMRSLFGSAPLIDEAATIITPPGVDGAVRFDWTLANTTLDIDSSPGPYLAWWFIDYGGGSVISTQEFDVEFLSHAYTERRVGPCTNWCSSQDVRACYADTIAGSCLSWAVKAAGEVLFEMSGRQFPGWCQSTIRPCSSFGCGMQILDRGHIVSWDGEEWHGDSEPCNCGYLMSVALPGTAQHVVQVMIDGQVIPPTSYRLDPDGSLIRTDGGAWPACQNMAADDGASGAFTVIYAHGYQPPEVGRRAAAQLAHEFWLACSGAPCQLPAGTVRVTRQGITIERTASLWADGVTGLAMVDSFLAVFNQNPAVLVLSPDIEPTSRRTA